MEQGWYFIILLVSRIILIPESSRMALVCFIIPTKLFTTYVVMDILCKLTKYYKSPCRLCSPKLSSAWHWAVGFDGLHQVKDDGDNEESAENCSIGGAGLRQHLRLGAVHVVQGHLRYEVLPLVPGIHAVGLLDVVRVDFLKYKYNKVRFVIFFS